MGEMKWKRLAHAENEISFYGSEDEQYSIVGRKIGGVKVYTLYHQGLHLATVYTQTEAKAAAERHRDATTDEQVPTVVLTQQERLTAEFAELLGKFVKVVQPEPQPDPATEDDVPELVERIVRRAQYVALKEVKDTLGGWIEGAKENHAALDHRNECSGEECWKTFHVDDIVSMIDDAARDLHIPAPPR